MSMTEQTREAVGLLCRWCALGLAWAGAGAGVLLGGASGAAHGEPPRVVLSDAACYEVPQAPPDVSKMYLKGRLLPPPPEGRVVRILVRYPERMADYGSRDRGPFYLPLERKGAGDHAVRVIGVPYVFPMFGGDEAFLRVLPSGARACLVACPLAARARGQGPQPWRALLAACRRLGDVVFLHPGPPEEFDSLRQSLRAEGVPEPVCCHLEGEKGAVSALYGLREALKQTGQAPAPVLLTDDEEQARRAVEWGMVAHWVAPAGAAPARAMERLHVHEGIEGLLRDLEAVAAERK